MARSAVTVAASTPLSIRTESDRAVLIGTIETVCQAREMLGMCNGSPEPVGCILVDAKKVRAGGGLPVFGTLEDLALAIGAQGITLAVVCLPMAMAETINRVRAVLREHGVTERFVPPVSDLLAQAPPFAVGVGTAAAMSPSGAGLVDVADLIGRKPHPLDRGAIARILTGKRVLITGAGGSIGSEIARIVCEFGPEQIQLVERAENPLFEIDRQIARRFSSVSRRAVLHDVVDPDATARLLEGLRPDVVFHAAAHKHVPLMEDHPAHAVTNNLFGTKSIADASVAAEVERFVMVSSDKAVNPTSVMGATKRLAELYIQGLSMSDVGCRISDGRAGTGSDIRIPTSDIRHSTKFSMVRFGNVLGSACSVLTIWSAQLAEGGPITVTDPRMTRYFMTISEAAGLVIQTGAIEYPEGAPAAVHVLDMGEPVEIVELAKRFLRAHGFEGRVAEGTGGRGCAAQAASGTGTASGLPVIDIVFTGARPGEKVHEELAYSAETLLATPYSGIGAWAGAGRVSGTAEMVEELFAARARGDREAVLGAIRRYVPEMRKA